MPISSESYRLALRQFASGVTVVTLRAGDKVHGLTVSAFASVSPDPPLIAVVIDHRHAAYPILELPEAVFAVNILTYEQRPLSDRFAWLKDEDRFDEGNWGTAKTGAPILVDALAWLDCTIVQRVAAGTHTVYIGQVEASATPADGEAPLVYWDRGYRQLRRHEDEG